MLGIIVCKLSFHIIYLSSLCEITILIDQSAHGFCEVLITCLPFCHL